MKLKRKLVKNEDGATSVLFQIIVLIIIGLLLWEFVLPLIGYDSLSSELGFSEDTPDNITFQAQLINEVKGANYEFISDKQLIDVDDDPRNEHENLQVYPMTKAGWWGKDNETWNVENHIFKITTNAPTRSFLPYKVKITMTEVSSTHKMDVNVRFEGEINDLNDGLFKIDIENNWVTIDNIADPWRTYTTVKIELISPLFTTIESYEFSIFSSGAVFA